MDLHEYNKIMKQQIETWAKKSQNGELKVNFIKTEDGLLQWPSTNSRYTDQQLRDCGWSK